jgi:hypothetical protein
MRFVERGHPVRLSARCEQASKVTFPVRVERASPAGGQGCPRSIHVDAFLSSSII